MKKIIEWHENLTPSKKLIVYVCGTIILGSIGSGIWVKIIDPFLNVTFHLLISLIGKFSSSYIDDLYGTAARGLYERPSTLALFSHVIIFYIGFLIISDVRRKKSDKREGVLWLIQMLLIFISITLMYHYTKIGVVNRITTSTLNSIEIVRPYVNDKDYYTLRSEFYQMRSLMDYENLYKKLKTICSNVEGIKIGPKQTF